MTTNPPVPEPPEPERPGSEQPGSEKPGSEQPDPYWPESQHSASEQQDPNNPDPAPAFEPPPSTPPPAAPPPPMPPPPPPPGAGYSPYGAVPPPPPPPPAYNGDGQQPRNGLGTAALVCGIIAIVLSFIPGLNAFTWPLGVLAIVFGAVGWSRANKGRATNKAIAITGLVLGILSFFTFCLIYVIIGAGSGSMYYNAAPML